jgi:aminoglycoside 2''-phosphotransferase
LSPGERSRNNEIQLFEEVIKNNFSGFTIQSSHKLGEGVMSVAILINDEWVFRFPKNQEGANDLEKELKIMPHLAKCITLAIPRFEYVGKQENGLPFVGYRKLPGDILGEDALFFLPKGDQKQIARQLAQFIDELSAFPVEKARELGVPVHDPSQESSISNNSTTR